MRFDRTELDHLERRELQLTILSAVLVLILSSGVALLMYPLVFVQTGGEIAWTPRVAYFGFCVLSLLFVGYLLDRHRTVRRLKQRLIEELDRNLKLREQANVDLLHTIPDLNHFRDCLAMEFRRAASVSGTLSLLVVKVRVTSAGPGSAEERTAIGEAARSICRKLRLTDSIYQFAPGVFGLVLGETTSAQAQMVSTRIKEVLRAVGATAEFSSEILIYNYPDDVTSAHELEDVVNLLLDETATAPPKLVGAEAH